MGPRLSKQECPKNPLHARLALNSERVTYFSSHIRKAQNYINKLRNSIGWDLFPLS